jgi:hypothetical protein
LRAASPRKCRRTSHKVTSAAAALALLLATSTLAGATSDPLDVRADARAHGDDVPTARTVARALLARPLDAQLTRVRCDALGTHRVCGLVLSGVKFHHPLDRRAFLAEVAALVRGAFAAAPLEEVDLWTTVPLDAGRGVVVSGDLAQPTSATVFAVTVRASELRGLDALLASGRNTFIDSEFAAALAKGETQ